MYACVRACARARPRTRVTFPPSNLDSSCSMSQPDNYR